MIALWRSQNSGKTHAGTVLRIHMGQLAVKHSHVFTAYVSLAAFVLQIKPAVEANPPLHNWLISVEAEGANLRGASLNPVGEGGPEPKRESIDSGESNVRVIERTSCMAHWCLRAYALDCREAVDRIRSMAAFAKAEGQLTLHREG